MIVHFCIHEALTTPFAFNFYSPVWSFVDIEQSVKICHGQVVELFSFFNKKEVELLASILGDVLGFVYQFKMRVMIHLLISICNLCLLMFNKFNYIYTDERVLPLEMGNVHQFHGHFVLFVN